MVSPKASQINQRWFELAAAASSLDWSDPLAAPVLAPANREDLAAALALGLAGDLTVF